MRRIVTLLFVSSLVWLSCIQIAFTDVHYVVYGGSGNMSGSSWQNAGSSIQAAIGNAVNSDEVWVAAGSYEEQLTLKEGVSLYGGFAGNEASHIDRGPYPPSASDPNETVISSNTGGPVVYSLSGITNATVIDGFTIRNKPNYGDGISCTSSSPTISHNRIMFNGSNGIYIALQNSNPIVEYNVISNNNSCGISCNLYTLATIRNNIVRSNKNSGIYFIGNSATIRNNFISGNSSSSYGGGIYCLGDATITNNTIVSNFAGGTTGCGGIYIAGSPTVSNNIIAYNSSGIKKASGSPSLSCNCVFANAAYAYSGLSAGSGDIDDDPELVDAECGNLHISSDSPCINNGDDNVGTSGYDVDGEARKTGSYIDIGADEYHSDAYTQTGPSVIVMVDDNGNDNNDGLSWTTPKATIQAAIDLAAQQGGEVWVKDGTYEENLTLYSYVYLYGGFHNNETEQYQRDWRSYTTTIDGSNGSYPVISADYVGNMVGCIDGFSIVNGENDLGAGIRCKYASTRISNNIIEYNDSHICGGGIYCGPGSFTKISNNIIRHNTCDYDSEKDPVGGGGIGCKLAYPTITNNLIYQNTNGGGVYISRNGVSTSLAPVLTNNTIVSNADAYNMSGIHCYYCPASINNNIIASNTGYGVYCDGSGASLPTIYNNDFYGNTTAYYPSSIWNTTNITSVPGFVNPSAGNYHLSSNSGCIGYGSNSVAGIPDIDMDGGPRISPINDYVDIGADEYDTEPPTFSNFDAVLAAAKCGDTVTITFTASENLSANPTVTVNGYSASFSSKVGKNYTYTYTVHEDEPEGEATIHATGYDLDSNMGEATNTRELYIVPCSSGGSACSLGAFTYDKNGNRKTMCDPRGTTVYFYDSRNRLTEVYEPDGKWIVYEYDGSSNRTKMTIHLDSSTAHVTQYTYNNRNQFDKVTDQLGGETTYTYYDNGLVDTIAYPNGTSAVHTYDSRNLLTELENKKSDGTVITKFTYSYDPTYWGKNGTRTRVIENILKPDGNRINAQVDYEYDSLYRLVHEHRIAYNGGDPGVAYEYNFAYDAAGNRIQWQIVGGTTTNYTYDTANKMLTAGSSTFTYDAAGNTLTEVNGGVTTTYTWDELNRLTEWQKTGETTQDYLYNADGIRVRVTPSSATAMNFLLDRKEIAEEITGSTAKAYVGPGLVCQISGTTRTVYHQDGLGSTRTISDGSLPLGIDEAGIYDAYGNRLQEYFDTGVTSPSFGYAGNWRYYSDSTGLDYLKARYYNPNVGRFETRDPIGYKGGLNLYAYVHGNPVIGVDPTGTITECERKKCNDWCDNRMKEMLDKGNDILKTCLLAVNWTCFLIPDSDARRICQVTGNVGCLDAYYSWRAGSNIGYIKCLLDCASR